MWLWIPLILLAIGLGIYIFIGVATLYTIFPAIDHSLGEMIKIILFWPFITYL